MSITGIRAARAYVELVMNDNKFTRGLQLAEAEMRAFANKMTAIGTQMFGGGAAMLTPITYAVRQFKEFDDTMRLVRAVTRATMKDFQQLSDKARLLGKTTSFTSQQVADAMANLGRAGFDPKQIDSMIKHVMNLARATQTGIAQSAEIVGNAMRQFGLEAKDAERIVDVMTATANNSSQTLDDIAQSFKYAAPIAKEFGLQMEEAAYYIGILANQGLKSEMAGTSLRNMLIRLTGADTQKRFTEDLQVKIRDAEGRVKNIKLLLSEANDAMNARGWDQLQRGKWLRDVFGLRAIAGGAKFLTVGDQFLNIMNAIADSEGAAARTAKEMDEGIGGAIRITISAFQELANVVGEAVTPELIEFGRYLQKLANEWIVYLKYHREVVVEWTKLGAGLAKWGAIFFGVGSVVRTFGTMLGGVIGSIKGVFTVFKMFSQATGDTDAEMKKAGSDTRKAGNDFSAASKEFRAAAQAMTNTAGLAVTAGKNIKEATKKMESAAKGAEQAGSRVERAGMLFESASGHAQTASSAFASISKQTNLIAQTFSKASAPMTAALKSFRNIVGFFAKSGEAVGIAVKEITDLSGTLVKFAESTKEAEAAFVEAGPAIVSTAKQLKSAGSSAAKIIQAMGVAAGEAGTGIEGLGVAMEGTAAATEGFAGTTETAVTGLEQLSVAAQTADVAAVNLTRDLANAARVSATVTAIDPQMLIQKRGNLYKKIEAERGNLESYYPSQRNLLAGQLASLQKEADTLPVGRRLQQNQLAQSDLQQKIKAIQEEEIAAINRVKAYELNISKIDKQLFAGGFVAPVNATERGLKGLGGISEYQQAQNRTLKSDILKDIEEQNALNAVPAYSARDVRNEVNRQNLVRNQYRRISPYSELPVSGRPNQFANDLRSEYGYDFWSFQSGMPLNYKPAQQPLVVGAKVGSNTYDLENRGYQGTISGGKSTGGYGVAFKPGKTVGGFGISANEITAAKESITELGGSVAQSEVQLSKLYNTLEPIPVQVGLFGDNSASAKSKVASVSKSVKDLEGNFTALETPVRNVDNTIGGLKKSVAGTSKALTDMGKSFRFVDPAMNIVQKKTIQTDKSALAMANSAKAVSKEFYDWSASSTNLALSMDTAEEQIKAMPPAISATSEVTKKAAQNFNYVGNAAVLFGKKVVSAIGMFAKTLGSIAAFTLAIEGIAWAFKKVKEQMDFRNGKLDLSFAAQEGRDSFVQSIPEDNERLKRLAEINAEHNKTNEMLQEAADIVGELQRKYGDLGLHVNRVTQEVEGLNKATGLLGQAQLEKEKIANQNTIKELEDNNKVIEDYIKSFTDRNLTSVEYLPISGPGAAPSQVKKAREQLDITDLIKEHGSNVMSRDNWRELYQEVYGKEVSSAFNNIQNPLEIMNSNGGTNIVAIEKSAVDPGQVEMYNKYSKELRSNNKSIEVLNERNEQIDRGDTKVTPKPILATPSVDFPTDAAMGEQPIMSTNEVYAGIHSGEIYKNLTPENYGDTQYSVRRALTALKDEEAALEALPSIQNISGLGALDIDALQATLESIEGAGSEEEQNMRVHILKRIEEFRAAIAKAVEEGTIKDFDYSQWSDIYSYGQHINIGKMIEMIKRDINNIYDQTMKEYEEVNGKYHILGTPDDKLISGEDERDRQLGERAAQRTANLVQQHDSLVAYSEAMSRGVQLQTNRAKQDELVNFLDTAPQTLVQADIDRINQTIKQAKQELEIGDSFQTILQNITDWADGVKNEIDIITESMEKIGKTMVDDLPIQEWNAKTKKEVDNIAEQNRQNRIDERNKQVANRIEGYEKQIGGLLGQTSTEERYKASLDTIRQQREELDKESEAIAKEAEEADKDFNGVSPKDWLKSARENNKRWYDSAISQLKEQMGVGGSSQNDEISEARQRQEVARQMGNEQGVAKEEAVIKELEYKQVMKDYRKALGEINTIEQRRNDNLKEYRDASKEVSVQEDKIRKMREDNADNESVAEEQKKLNELIKKRDNALVNYAESSDKFGKSINLINAVEAYSGAQLQQQLWDINRSYGSSGTFDAYSTNGMDVSTMNTELKEQTELLGSIEEAVQAMAGGEWI